MFYLEEEGWAALLLLWVAFMTVVGVYVIRIGLMIHELRARERGFRLQLAMRRGRAAREAAILPTDAGRSDG
jgi:primosomal protein N'